MLVVLGCQTATVSAGEFKPTLWSSLGERRRSFAHQLTANLPLCSPNSQSLWFISNFIQSRSRLTVGTLGTGSLQQAAFVDGVRKCSDRSLVLCFRTFPDLHLRHRGVSKVGGYRGRSTVARAQIRLPTLKAWSLHIRSHRPPSHKYWPTVEGPRKRHSLGVDVEEGGRRADHEGRSSRGNVWRW